MNNYAILGDLCLQLQESFNSWMEIISNKENLILEDSKSDLNDMYIRIKTLLIVVKREIENIRTIKNKEIEYSKLLQINKKNDERLIELNRILSGAINDLKSENNLFKLSSTHKNISQSSFQPRDLINFTMRVNTNYSFPHSEIESNNAFLPSVYLNPYPVEEKEMRHSFLKFNYDEKQRLLMPDIKPAEGFVKKGTILEIRYPDKSVQDVFFKYTLSNDLIPTYFSGQLYNSNSPYIIENDAIIKVCSSKFGYMDSKIKTISFKVTDEVSNVISRVGVRIGPLGAMRPEVLINEEEEGYRPIQVNLDDDISSHCTPGSMYQISMHKRESYIDNDDGL